MSSNSDRDVFIKKLLKNNSREMAQVDEKAEQVVRATLRKFQAKYGNLISHYDFETFIFDIKQEVLTSIVKDCHDIVRQKYLENINLHIRFLAFRHVDRVFDKVASNRGASLTKMEKVQIGEAIWPDSETAEKRKIYRQEAAFLSFDQGIEDDDSIWSQVDVIDYDTYDLITSAMSTLSDAHKDAVILYFFEGFTQSEVAAKLHVDVRTIHTRLKESVARMKDVLKNSGES